MRDSRSLSLARVGNPVGTRRITEKSSHKCIELDLYNQGKYFKVRRHQWSHQDAENAKKEKPNRSFKPGFAVHKAPACAESMLMILNFLALLATWRLQTGWMRLPRVRGGVNWDKYISGTALAVINHFEAMALFI